MFDLSSFALGFHIVAAFHFAVVWREERNPGQAFGFWWSVAFGLFALFCLVVS